MRAARKTWAETVEPIAQRLAVAGAFGCDFVHGPAGALATSQLLRDMARKLDVAVSRETAT
ncbi:MAG: hypothetical protein ABIO43_02000 [Sphingomicrobium sp.]